MSTLVPRTVIQPTGKAGVDLCNVEGNPGEEGDEDEANPHHGTDKGSPIPTHLTFNRDGSAGGENKSCRYSVIVTFICQLACIMGCLESWLNIISQCICERDRKSTRLNSSH